MKHSISCQIEYLAASGETAWILSLPAAVLPDAVTLLSALIYEKTNQVKFAGQTHTAQLCVAPDGYWLNLDGMQIAVTKVWLETVLGMLLDTRVNGWSVTSHIDHAFENTSVTVAVLPPNT